LLCDSLEVQLPSSNFFDAPTFPLKTRNECAALTAFRPVCLFYLLPGRFVLRLLAEGQNAADCRHQYETHDGRNGNPHARSDALAAAVVSDFQLE
jgi:hypothetical protein